jgi:hypothetical protein
MFPGEVSTRGDVLDEQWYPLGMHKNHQKPNLYASSITFT